MAFSKLAILALLALQSITAYAALDLSSTITFPGLSPNSLPILVQGMIINIGITVKNNGPDPVTLQRIYAKQTTNYETTYNPEDLPPDYEPAAFLREINVDSIIQPGEQMTTTYETMAFFRGDQLWDYPAEVRFEVVAVVKENNVEQALDIYDKMLQYHEESRSTRRPYLRKGFGADFLAPSRK